MFSYLEPACSVLGDIPHTFISSIWVTIRYGFSHYWYIIFPVIVLWVIFEITTMHGHSYNSDNGFTPLFNKFVGGGVFCLSETIIQFILGLFSKESASCVQLFTASFYLLPFITTGLFLHLIRFWPYWKLPFVRAKIRLY